MNDFKGLFGLRTWNQKTYLLLSHMAYKAGIVRFVKQFQKSWSIEDTSRTENNLYFDFTINARGILNQNTNSWETLFLMRHYGLPTRILDWTENLNMALYFAIYGLGRTPCIWVLDPHKLNQLSLGSSTRILWCKDSRWASDQIESGGSRNRFENKNII